MYRELRHIAVMLLGILFSSCIFDRGECLVAEPLQTGNIMFRVEVNTPSESRGAWSDLEPTDEIGNSFENRILPGALRAAIYNSDNEHLGFIEELVWWQISGETAQYQFMGRVPTALLDHISSLSAGESPEYKFMVFANSPEGIDSEIVFDFEEVNLQTGAIPMWGVSQVDLSELIATGNQDIGTIWLLRSVAKIEVVTDNPLCHIEQVNINHHNRMGYCLPEGWDGVESTLHIDRTLSLRAYRSLHSGNHYLSEHTEGKKFVMYLPEYDNSLFAEYEAKLSVVLSYGEEGSIQQLEFDDALQFCSYNNGVPTSESYNIVRNTIYRFNITDIKRSGLVLNYEVADWTEADGGEWNQHFDYPTYHNPVLPDNASRDGDSSNDIYPEQPQMYYSAPNTKEQIRTEVGAFSCWFQILAPESQLWLPTIREGSNMCHVRVYKEQTDGALQLVYSSEPNVADNIASGELLEAYSGWYNIKVIPTTPDYEELVSFGITYTQDWMMGGTRYLLINGEVDHIIWPNSGNEPRLVYIQQIVN